MAWVITALLSLLLLLSLLPVRLRVSFVQAGWQTGLTFVVGYALFCYRREIDLTGAVQGAAEHLWRRSQERGAPIDPDPAETVGKIPRANLVRALLPALRCLGRSTRCHRLRLDSEVGGADAMESALLAGALWSLAGMAVGAVSRAVQLPREAVELSVRPRYDRAAFRLTLDCIFSVPLGKAIMATVWLLMRAADRRAVVAWVRDSLRRKGEQADGRSSDQGSHDGGHGKP